MLGPLEVVRDGAAVDLPGGKPRLLLAALLVNPSRVVSTDRLFEVLWGADVPGSAQNLLQTYSPACGTPSSRSVSVARPAATS
jgi:DNA-binding SARP family transcriptional activator